MIRELVRIGSITITPFGVLMAAAFVAAYFQLVRAFRQTRVGTEEDANAVVVSAAVGGIIGAKVYYALLYSDWRLLVARGGLVWYGGFLLGTVAVLLVIRHRRLPLWKTVDATVPSLALGYAIGRIGCFLVGDDYGVPTDLPWGVKFPVGLPPTHAGALRSSFGLDLPADIPDDALLAVHPTQLYEAVAALIIWRVGLRLLARPRRDGTTFSVVVALLLAERFLVEFLRAKDDRFFGAFTLAQIIAVVALVLVGWLWIFGRGSGPDAAHGKAEL
ncbi:MAG: prolipoprotein diacylglyceryl transferase [Acidobacteriota bacterium]|nr:MAG: prolipoprotein diacylglyceryl transferase [Acidobacteriota bacterium]